MCCVTLPCLFDLACFFLPSFFITLTCTMYIHVIVYNIVYINVHMHTYTYMYIHVHAHCRRQQHVYRGAEGVLYATGNSRPATVATCYRKGAWKRMQ